MRTTLQLAAIITLTTATIAHAQITSPDKLVAPAPRNPAHARPTETDDYQWLWQYAKPSNKPALLEDPRFKALLKDNFKAPQAMWGIGTPLNEVAQKFLAGEGSVTPVGDGVIANRYLAVNGCVVDHCQQRGLLYADLGERDPLLVFAALRWNEQGKAVDQPNAPYTLWLFSSRALDSQHLPKALQNLLHDWLWLQHRACIPYQITNVIVVDPSGIPHIVGPLDAGIQPIPCISTPGSHL